MRDGLVLDGPDLSGRQVLTFVQIDGKNDITGSFLNTQNDVVIFSVRIQENFVAIDSVKSTLIAIERIAVNIGEGKIIDGGSVWIDR